MPSNIYIKVYCNDYFIPFFFLTLEERDTSSKLLYKHGMLFFVFKRFHGEKHFVSIKQKWCGSDIDVGFHQHEQGEIIHDE